MRSEYDGTNGVVFASCFHNCLYLIIYIHKRKDIEHGSMNLGRDDNNVGFLFFDNPCTSGFFVIPKLTVK